MMLEKNNSLHSKSATINDVAKLSGTSIATVSRVLSGSSYPVSSTTRKRVLEAAEKLHYSQNLLGHMLKSKNNKCLGIIIPTFQNPFYTQLIMGIEKAARLHGYTTFVFSSQRNIENERMLISQLRQLKISGLLLSSIDPDTATVNSYLDTGSQVAIFEAPYPVDPRAIDATSCMDENGYIATSHLLELGHRSIAFLTTPLTHHSRQMVSKGYHKAMSEHHIPVEKQDVFEFPFEQEIDDTLFEFEAGKALSERLLLSPKRYSAVVGVNDIVACGVIHGLLEHNVQIPDDISVVGIDNILQGVMMTPTLTSVHQDNYEHSQNVCFRLIERLESDNFFLNERCYRAPKLISRNSTKAFELSQKPPV